MAAIQRKKAMIRPHLVECVRIGKLTSFPQTGQTVICDTATLNVELCWLCRVFIFNLFNVDKLTNIFDIWK